MGIWFLLQIVLNIVLILAVTVLWLRMKRPPKDDPRLSRGLQLLQSKISVLEDLSDRTDRQVDQLTALLDQKARQLQGKIFDAEKQIQKVQSSMDRSMEVAEIFQDKIPHSEIIERQNTLKYITAARMAHQGKSLEEIEQQVDLPREQLEFIAKVNKEELMFDDEQLPAWAQNHIKEQVEFHLAEEDLVDGPPEPPSDDFFAQPANLSAESMAPVSSEAFSVPKKDYESLKKLGEEFRQACKDYDSGQQRLDEDLEWKKKMEASPVYKSAKELTQKIVDSASEIISEPFHRRSPEEVTTASMNELFNFNKDEVPGFHENIETEKEVEGSKTFKGFMLKERDNLNSQEKREETSSKIKKLEFPKIGISKTIR